MPKAKKLPSGNWRALAFYMDGKTKRRKSFTAPTKKEAEIAAAMFVMEHLSSKSAGTMTLGQAMDAYIELKKAVLSPSTIRGYQNIVNSRFTGCQDKRLSDITNDDLQREINIDARKVKYKTLKNGVGFLSAVMKQYRPDFRLDVVLPQRDKVEANIPTDADVTVLLNFAYDTDTEVYKAIILAAYAGLRRGEIVALKWSDIDFDNKVIKINKAMALDENNNWTLKKPKSYSGYRDVPLLKVAADALLPFKDDGNVIQISGNRLTDHYVSLAKKLDMTHFTFHNLRHYYASVMLALGIPDKYAMELMGHSTTHMLKTVYQHTIDSKKKESVELLDNYFTREHS